MLGRRRGNRLGQMAGAQWPASAPTVLSVGGTSLSVADQNGSHSSEQSWAGSGGGYSTVETEPTFQDGAQTSGTHSVPDVAYDGDPSTGFAVYDSLPDQGQSGWQEVGGSSAGSPQWASLIALVNQARVSAGKGTLDGATQTLPLLYSVYSAPGTAVALRVPFQAPAGRAPGTYNLLASITSSTTIQDSDTANDVAAVAAA